ncbi:hypothetical protein MO867_07360 [Microbulbifer sp. OS29]|uniref:Gp5/Type VI secretion system Vgr protein OB-fold domain-containing protein n=1 Tax=Microbulbifer okhotskensis TaxID=2926617 RepID=A0A9X2EN34_9GAMM|nr:hypothetical protein [Microbulbifer okhotskensis]MCO1334160.1 hypothetical protein [Microbulbifer okhotskensis]
MDQQIKRIISRLYPEINSGLHLPILAKVVAISDPMQQQELAEEYRPRYGVDVQVLRPDGLADEELPIFRSVPLPLQNSGNERGAFGFPQPGTVVELTFAYGQPDQPFIRTVLSRGVGVPTLDREDLAWQQSDSVRQRVDAHAEWSRETHGDIRENSLRRIIEAAELQTRCDSEYRQVKEHSIDEIAGVKIIEALGALRFLSGGSLNLSALDNLNITTASDINISAGRDLKEQIGNIRESIAKAEQTIKVKNGGKVWLGSEALNVLKVLEDLIGVVSALAGTLATHSHPSSGQKPTQDAAITAHQTSADNLKSQLTPIVA